MTETQVTMTNSLGAFTGGSSRRGSASVTEAECKDGTTCSSTDLRKIINAREESHHMGAEVKKQDAATQMRPPDGGWGWLVVLGCVLIMTLSSLFGICFGVIFSRYLMEERSSSSTNAWIFNTMYCLWNMTGIFIRPLTSEFGWRKVGVFGGLLCSVSYVMSAFTPSPEFLFFSFSLLGGVGAGMMVTMCLVIVPLYFDKKRGVANAIMLGGMSFGQIVAPPVVRFLQDEFSFRGATMILGALVLHGCLGASFFHPIEWHLKKPTLQRESLPPEDEAPMISPKESKLCISEGLVNSQSPVAFAIRTDDLEADTMRARGGRPFVSETSSESRKSSSLCTSTLDLNDIETVTDADQRDEYHPDDEDPQKTSSSVCSVMFRVLRSTISDLGILRSPRACIIAVAKSLSLNAGLNFMMIVPFAMQAAGHTLDDSAWCISVLGMCSLLFRILVSSLSDCKRFNTRVCYVFGFALISFSTFIFPLLTDLTWLLATMALLGCGIGVNMGVANLVMIDVMGRKKFPTTFGASCFTGGVGFICLGPLLGVIRDTSNSYALSILVMASMQLTSFTLWLFMPAAIRYDERKTKEEDEENN
ncbi:monocarboxylate transporter 12-B-like [Homarus americanus]|uniref:Monocarboxylate transporter 12-B-like 4 n=1 Tax=Homarus americanus TaxID=6706 RepID=A0A8J5K6Y0_HOMAM|nr:monocarboxylate transporter 12-B-like [Homarus americanus]KAG7168115.1 Monocarboxylate transporter 12-B-like 4 [Homarus americanus]